MIDKLDQDLDEMLSRHMRECLDGQLGRASEAMRKELSPRYRWRLWLSAGTAVAAGIAVALMVLNYYGKASDIVKKPPPEQAIVADVPMLQTATWSPMVDDGTTLVDDRPMRRMKRKIVEEVEWYDAKQGATVKTTTPRQQIFMIELKTD